MRTISQRLRSRQLVRVMYFSGLACPKLVDAASLLEYSGDEFNE
jgi:hypothetical protein